MCQLPLCSTPPSFWDQGGNLKCFLLLEKRYHKGKKESIANQELAFKASAPEVICVTLAHISLSKESHMSPELEDKEILVASSHSLLAGLLASSLLPVKSIPHIAPWGSNSSFKT